MGSKLNRIMEEEQDLLAKMSKDDQIAFRKLYDRHANSIYKYALHLLKSEEEAHENVQDTFLRLWNSRKRGERLLNVESFLVTISRNLSIDALRKSKLASRSERAVKLAWSEEHYETEERLIILEIRSILQRGINELPSQQKLVYQLCHQEGMKYEEVAKELQISVNTVKLYMKLSLKFLRDYLSRNADIGIFLILFKLI